MRWNYICAVCGRLVDIDGKRIVNKIDHPHPTKAKKLSPMQELDRKAKAGEFLNSWKIDC